MREIFTVSLLFFYHFFDILFFTFFVKKEAICTKKVKVYLPAYVPEFQCKCGDCRSVCCHGWRIQLTEREHARLMQLSCSGGLRSRMDKSFALFEPPTSDAFAYIAHGPDGLCPILDEEGLCALHAECGEDVQPAVCRRYPRAVHPGDPVEMSCAGSCEAVAELLMAAPHPLPFIYIEGEISGEVPEFTSLSEGERAVSDRCIALMQSDLPITDRLNGMAPVLGAPVTPWSVRHLLTAARILLLGFGREGNSITALAAGAMADFALIEGVTDRSAALFEEAEARFAALYPDAERWYGNLLVNHLFFRQFPGREVSRRDAFAALQGVYVLLRVLTVSHAGKIGTAEAFADAASAVFRRVEHSNFYGPASQLLRGAQTEF